MIIGGIHKSSLQKLTRNFLVTVALILLTETQIDKIDKLSNSFNNTVYNLISDAKRKYISTALITFLICKTTRKTYCK